MTEDEIAELSRLIRARETQVAAQIVALLALAETGFDTSEAETALWRETDALTALRRQQMLINETKDR
ncbi:hypothetical protein FHR71_003659 [Methylobacterium sp. RAS18]|nr:hypothetical protein [Methylobacterium sp. RAS18]